MNSKRKWIVAAGLLVCLLGFLLVSRPAVPPLQITFIGYTNGARGELQAIFSVTNTSDDGLEFGVLPTQIRDGSGWKATAVRDEHFLTHIQPGSGRVCIWAIFETNTVWRQPVSYWSSGQTRHRLSEFLMLIHLRKRHDHFGSTVFSDPITEPPPRPEPKT
jgi:hypothetical protein